MSLSSHLFKKKTEREKKNLKKTNFEIFSARNTKELCDGIADQSLILNRAHHM